MTRNVIQVRVTESEKALMVGRAKEAGLSLSEFARRELVGGVEGMKPSVGSLPSGLVSEEDVSVESPVGIISGPLESEVVKSEDKAVATARSPRKPRKKGVAIPDSERCFQCKRHGRIYGWLPEKCKECGV